MILAIDIGNTNIVIGCMDREEVLFTERLSTDPAKTSMEYAILFRVALDMHQIDPVLIAGAIISSVVPQITPVVRTALRKTTGRQAYVLGPGTRTGLNIRIDDPSSVGADLVAGAVGALALFKPPLVVVDMGTATTLSVVDRDGNYIGGTIMPGLRLSLTSLVSRTSMLQGTSLDVPKHVIGSSTAEAMRSGIVLGHAAAIDGLLDRVEEELGEKVTVVATGGLASKVIPCCRHKITLDNALLLTGLSIIYGKMSGDENNAKKRKGIN